jgi:hypothetical protein
MPSLRYGFFFAHACSTSCSSNHFSLYIGLGIILFHVLGHLAFSHLEFPWKCQPYRHLRRLGQWDESVVRRPPTQDNLKYADIHASSGIRNNNPSNLVHLHPVAHCYFTSTFLFRLLCGLLMFFLKQF